MKYKRIQFKNMSVDQDEGVFEGYGSAFSVLDSDGDIVEPGAYAKTLSVGSAKNGVPILAQHNEKLLPLGKTLSLSEDEHGLKVKGYISPTSLGWGKENISVNFREKIVTGLDKVVIL